MIQTGMYAQIIKMLLMISVLTLSWNGHGIASGDNIVFDGDADGVADQLDLCLDSVPGVPVDRRGCSLAEDQDGDGLSDRADACPFSPSNAVTDDQGCALDEDIDGVADGIDRCPGSPFSTIVDALGCASGQVAAVALREPTPPSVARPVAALPSPPPAVAQSPSSKPRATAVAQTARESMSGAVAQPPIRVILVPFVDGEAVLKGSAEIDEAVDVYGSALRALPHAVLLISGHSDPAADGSAGRGLAASRAVAVRRELLARGVAERQLHMQVAGAVEPRLSGAFPAPKARAEIRLLTGGKRAPVRVTAAAESPVESPAVSSPSPRARVPAPPSLRVGFKPYSAFLEPKDRAALDHFTKVVLARKGQDVVMVTGAIGDEETGRAAHRLAESRAATVRAYLVSAGLQRSDVRLAAGAADNADSGSGARVELQVIQR